MDQIAGDRADVQAVVEQVEHAAQAERQPAGKGLEADAHVVPDVVGEHDAVVLPVAAIPQLFDVLAIHLLKGRMT
jgi:hypothetical protein